VTLPRWPGRGAYPAIALIGLGLAALYAASSLPFGTARQPDSAFFPVLVSAALVLFAVLALASGGQSAAGEGESEPAEHARVWSVIVALAAYAGLIKSAGFIICTTLLVLLLLRGIGRVSWTAALAGAVLGSAGCYALFTRLGMPLPAGILGF
jgi:tripartite tricarboxylate transporter TctB family protein